MNGTLAIAEQRQRRRASLSDPGPPYAAGAYRRRRSCTATRLDVSRASHTHHTPQAFRAHSGPVTSESAPNSTASSAAAYAMIGARALENSIADAGDAGRRSPPRGTSEPDGMWKIEDLLDEAHRRLVRRGVDRSTAHTRTSPAASDITAVEQREHSAVGSRPSVGHHRLERPERQGDEHYVEDHQQREPELRHRQIGLRAEITRRSRAPRQS